MELLGMCRWCGCPVYRDGPVEFEGVWCDHEVQTGVDEEVKRNETENLSNVFAR